MKNQRFEAIKLYASKKKVFTIEELCTQLNVSTTTIRRDVSFLAKEGFLTKYYGRLVWNEADADGQKEAEEAALSAQSGERGKEDKEIELRLARAAADLVEDNDYIYIESGSFVFPMMIKCINKKNVTVATSDLLVAMNLMKNEALNVIVLGGCVWRGSYLLHGDITEQALAGMRFSKYFTLPGTITSSGEVMYFDAHTSGLRNMLRQVSEKTVVLVDRTRINRTAFLKIGTLEDCDVIITNCCPEELPPVANPNVKIISTWSTTSPSEA